MKKNVLKTAIAAALLTSSILVFSPIAFAKTDNVEQSIHSLKNELNKATTQYVQPALEGKLVPSNLLYATLDSAKKNYQNTKNTIVTSKLSVKEKESKLNEIDSLYSEKISKGLVPYIDAYNYATRYLAPIMNEIILAEANNDVAAVEKGYHKLSYQLKDRTAILYRFSGKAARDLLLAQYKVPADTIRDELMVPVTIHMKLVELNDLFTAGKKVEALKTFAEITALLDNLPKDTTNKFSAILLKEVEKVKALVNTIPPTQAEQQDLDEKVASLVTALNTNQGKYFTASSAAHNSLVLTIKEDISILNFLGQGFYSPFISNLGVTKINGNEPLSEAALNDLRKVFSTEVKTLADLKGQTITLPLTVKNGSELDVNFIITFQ